MWLVLCESAPIRYKTHLLVSGTWVLGVEPCSSQNIFLSCRRYIAILRIARITVPDFYVFRKLNHTSLYGTTENGASIDPASQICSSAILVLLTAVI
jgi:hypothetical protein